MRLLYFTRDYTTHDHRFLQAFTSRGLEVGYLRLEDSGIAYETRAVPDGVQEVAWSGGKTRAETPEQWLALMPDFARVLSEYAPDVLYAGPVQSCGFMGAMAGHRPLAIMSWGSDVLRDSARSPLWRWMTSYALARADLLVCDSNTVVDRARELGDLRDSAILSFPWGPDLPEGLVADSRGRGRHIRSRLEWAGCRVVLSTRAWEPVYGVDTVLEAFRQARQVDPDLRLVLLGEGSLGVEFRLYLEEHDLLGVVHSPGLIARKEVLDYFSAADIYVSAAHSDGTSVSLLEAMEFGPAIVVTDIPSNREWIEPGRNGWLAEAGRPDSFSAALLAASRQPDEERERYSRRNREVLRECAVWEENADTLVRAVLRISDEHASSRT